MMTNVVLGLIWKSRQNDAKDKTECRRREKKRRRRNVARAGGSGGLVEGGAEKKNKEDGANDSPALEGGSPSSPSAFIS